MRPRITRGLWLTVLLSFLVAVSGCSGEVDLTCDDPRRYQEAVERERLKTPQDLDAPEPYLEMPVPEANPRPVRPKGSPCLDLPPPISRTE